MCRCHSQRVTGGSLRKLLATRGNIAYAIQHVLTKFACLKFFTFCFLEALMRPLQMKLDMLKLIFLSLVMRSHKPCCQIPLDSRKLVP